MATHGSTPLSGTRADERPELWIDHRKIEDQFQVLLTIIGPLRVSEVRTAVLLDRDGTIVNADDYVLSREDVVLFEDVSALHALTDAGVALAIVSNQSAVGRRLLSWTDVLEVHDEVLLKLQAKGVEVAVSVLCPHIPTDACSCRKPRPGMLLAACGHLGVDARSCYMVGNSRIDMQAGSAAGARSFLIRAGPRQMESSPLAETVDLASSLSECVDRILGDLRARATVQG